MEQIRLQKYLADAGIASRRKAEELIKQGKVYVNGKIVNELGTKVTPNVDIPATAICMSSLKMKIKKRASQLLVTTICHLHR